MRLLRRLLLILFSVALVASVGLGILITTTGQPTPTATAATVSDGQVRVTTDRWLAF